MKTNMHYAHFWKDSKSKPKEYAVDMSSNQIPQQQEELDK